MKCTENYKKEKKNYTHVICMMSVSINLTQLYKISSWTIDHRSSRSYSECKWEFKIYSGNILRCFQFLSFYFAHYTEIYIHTHSTCRHNHVFIAHFEKLARCNKKSGIVSRSLQKLININMYKIKHEKIKCKRRKI